MKYENSGDLAVTPETRRYCHVELRWIQIRQVVKAERRIVAVDALDFLVPVSGPQCPQNKVRAVTGWKEGEPIDSTMFAEPVSGLHMVGMRVLGKASRLRLLGREKPLLLFGEFKKSVGRFAVRLCQNTILQLYCGYIKNHVRDGGHRSLHVFQGLRGCDNR